MVIIIIASVFSVILFFMGIFKCYQRRCWCFKFRKEKSATNSTIPSENNNKNNSIKDIVSNPFFMGCGGTFGIEPMHCFEYKVNDWYSTQKQCFNSNYCNADGKFSRLNGKQIDCINDCDRIAFKMDRKQNLFPDWATKEFVKFAPSKIKKNVVRKESLEPLLDKVIITDEEQQINTKVSIENQQQNEKKNFNMQLLRFNSRVKVIPWDAENTEKIMHEQNGTCKKKYQLSFEPLQYRGRGEVVQNNNDKDTGVIPLCEGDDDDEDENDNGQIFNDDMKNKGQTTGNNYTDMPFCFKDQKDCCQLNVFSQAVKINWIQPNEEMQSQSSDLSSDGRSRHQTEDEDDADCKDKIPHKQQHEE